MCSKPQRCAPAGFEACSRPRWRHDQGATSGGRIQQAAAADEGDPAQRCNTADTDQAAAAAAAPGIDASAGPSSQVAVQAGPADVGSPSRGAAPRKRRRDRDWSGDTAGPQTKLQRCRMATRAAASAGVAAEPVTQPMAEQSRRRAPEAGGGCEPELGRSLGDAQPDRRQMRVRSAARKLHAARLAAELAGLSEPTVGEEASPSAGASEDGTSDASGAASLAEGAANGDDAVAGDQPQTLCGWLLSLVGRR